MLQQQREQISNLQQQVETMKSTMKEAKQTSESQLTPTDPGDVPDAPVIPVAPPPPPIMEDGSLIPPPPPIPFGEPVSQTRPSCIYQAGLPSLCIHTGAPPIPPPPPIGGHIGIPGVPMKKAVIPNVPLPMLNWIPIRNPDHTIFKVTWNSV